MLPLGQYGDVKFSLEPLKFNTISNVSLFKYHGTYDGSGFESKPVRQERRIQFMTDISLLAFVGNRLRMSFSRALPSCTENSSSVEP